ncbi:sulfate adenylyltransferase [Limimonas halophila]|uniref:Adenylyl-sulfate kinase n=1 Tax=Limimonas halophila TaxID=1082479 RepID=A0A1G7LVY9_9PROT|nr:bifunctional sulfate adenylyltransferase/adenylylsulfate kinase [Limimonas halophila]SDF53554.1 sulfate adenylyltransferase [Limimonas halophila]
MSLPGPIAPYGGVLTERYLSGDALAAERERALSLPSLTLTARQLADAELLLNGGFSPLEGFMTRADYERCVREMRLADGTLWPMPITLDIPRELAERLAPGDGLALRGPEGQLVATLDVAELWEPDRPWEAEAVFGTGDHAHPGVHHVLSWSQPVYVGGRLNGVAPPVHHDFPGYRHSPRQLREHLDELGWQRVVAFQTRNPMHRAHVEMTRQAAEQTGAGLLLHPVVGLTKPGDVDHYTRVRCYDHVVRRYEPGQATMSLLHLAMRMGGPREALWHALIRRNHGCTHFIVGRDHAGPGKLSDGSEPYGPYDAQELVDAHRDEIGIRMVPFQLMSYVAELDTYLPADRVEPHHTVRHISGTQFRQKLRQGEHIPEWFSFPEVVGELRRTYPPRHRQGFTLFFTGLSGAGKSTLANVLHVKLREQGDRSVSLLDGDIVRTHLSSELGFSKRDRDINVRRIGYVASEITKAGGIAICAPVAPYADTRQDVRELIAGVGGFVEVHVATPLSVCEARDTKGLYAKARQGQLTNFTGIDDPYEPPQAPDVRVDTAEASLTECVEDILDRLRELGYVRDT